MKKRSFKGNLILLTAAVLWGTSFVAQEKAANVIGSFTLNGIRSLIGSFVLVIFIAFLCRKNGTKMVPPQKEDRKNLIIASLVCGVCLCVSVNLQTVAIAAYPQSVPAPARTGFITALYVIIVPIMGVFTRRKIGANVWVAALLSVAGLALLCLKDGFGGLYGADFIVFLCAISFSVHIVCIDYFAAKVDGIKLSCLQFFVCGVLSTVLMLVFEKPVMSDILACTIPILYMGVMSSGVAYTCQIIGQKYAENPTVSSIIMSLESVFAALAGMLFGDVMTTREVAGCAVMFAAIVLSQLDLKQIFKKTTV